MPCSTFIQIRRGEKFDFLRPDPSVINIEDIARSLSLLPRYVAQSDRLISVAQHSVLCSYAVTPGFGLEALLHDAHEAYVQDVPAPVKKVMQEISLQWYGTLTTPWDEIEGRARRVVAKRFGLPAEVSPEVHRVDSELAQSERLAVFDNRRDDWWPSLDQVPKVIAVSARSDTLDASCWERLFLDRYYDLINADTLSRDLVI